MKTSFDKSVESQQKAAALLFSAQVGLFVYGCSEVSIRFGIEIENESVSCGSACGISGMEGEG